MTFTPHSQAQDRTRSAVTLIKVLLANERPEVLPTHRQELLGKLLWKITEAESTKYKTRFQSENALKFRGKGELRHDHVYQCVQMIDKLVKARPEEIDGILETAVGCTVTLEEHSRLHRFDEEYGWERYRKAGVTVTNIETGERVI